MVSSERRVRILIDFWNFQLGWNTFHNQRGLRRKICWQKLPEVLVPLAATAGEGLYHGCHVYASVGPTQKDDNLRKFLHSMNGFPGYTVTVKDRKVKSAPCPHCNEVIDRTVEKGVDTALVTDLIQAAMDDLFDDAVLISGDTDFIPAVEFVQNRSTKRVIHAHFPRSGPLRTKCWSHLVLDEKITDQLAVP